MTKCINIIVEELNTIVTWNKCLVIGELNLLIQFTHYHKTLVARSDIP